jgi:hypothetical protein
MFAALFKRWGDAALLARAERDKEALASLREELDKERAAGRVKDSEISELAAVIARNIKRVEAETAAAAKAIASAER